MLSLCSVASPSKLRRQASVGCIYSWLRAFSVNRIDRSVQHHEYVAWPVAVCAGCEADRGAYAAVEAGNVDWVFSHARSSDATLDGTTPAARTVAVGGRMSASHQTMVLLADIGGASFELHESLLPYHPEHYDIGWIRGPLYVSVPYTWCGLYGKPHANTCCCSLAVAVAVVIGYQVLKRRGSDAPGPSVEEIAKTLRVPGADGSLGGASGGRFSRGGLGSRAGIGSRGGQPAFR